MITVDKFSPNINKKSANKTSYVFSAAQFNLMSKAVCNSLSIKLVEIMFMYQINKYLNFADAYIVVNMW